VKTEEIEREEKVRQLTNGQMMNSQMNTVNISARNRSMRLLEVVIYLSSVIGIWMLMRVVVIGAVLFLLLDFTPQSPFCH